VVVVLAVLLAKLIDPISIVLALLASFTARRWWHVILIGVIIAAVIETVSTGLQPTHRWGSELIAGVVASTLHAFVGWILTVNFRRKRVKGEPDFQSPSDGFGADYRDFSDRASAAADDLAAKGASLRTAASSAVSSLISPSTVEAAAEQGAIDSRLQELKALFEKGLISQQEYDAGRKRVLEGL
jgi:hypothetical protein